VALVSGGADVLEWDAAGYGFRLVAWHGDPAALLDVARGVTPSAVWSLVASDPPEPTTLPPGTVLVEQASAPSAIDGVGTLGWGARYRAPGRAVVVVRISAAAGRPEPLGAVVSLVPDAVVHVHENEAVGFDFGDSAAPVRSRVLWGDETVMFEATSETLALADLVIVLEAAALGAVAPS
jgi:hypothetical protein